MTKTRTPELVHRIAIHEAGHAVVAAVCKSKHIKATIVPDEIFEGKVDYEGQERNVEGQILICFGGAFAEAILSNSANTEGAVDDISKIKIACAFFGRDFNTLGAESYDIVKANWDAVQRVAAALEERGTITEDTIYGEL